MPKLYSSPASPFSAKVKMGATLAELPFEIVAVDTGANPANLIDANPLGKIPVWMTDEGQAIFDSPVIMQYLNRVSGNKLYPRNPAKRLDAEMLEALADGTCDCLLAIVYERRSRPEEKLHQPWIDRQWAKVERSLDHLNAQPPKLPKQIGAGQVAVRAMIGYLDLRFAGNWEKGRSKLRRWAVKFDEKWPELAKFAPHG